MNRVFISSCNGLSPARHQTITWPIVELFSISLLETNYSKIETNTLRLSVKKIHFEISSVKCRPVGIRPRCFNNGLANERNHHITRRQRLCYWGRFWTYLNVSAHFSLFFVFCCVLILVDLHTGNNVNNMINQWSMLVKQPEELFIYLFVSVCLFICLLCMCACVVFVFVCVCLCNVTKTSFFPMPEFIFVLSFDKFHLLLLSEWIQIAGMFRGSEMKCVLKICEQMIFLNDNASL